MNDDSMGFIVELKGYGVHKDKWFEVDIAPDWGSAEEIALREGTPARPCRIRAAPRWIVIACNAVVSYGSRELAEAAVCHWASMGLHSKIVNP